MATGTEKMVLEAPGRSAMWKNDAWRGVWKGGALRPFGRVVLLTVDALCGRGAPAQQVRVSSNPCQRLLYTTVIRIGPYQ